MPRDNTAQSLYSTLTLNNSRKNKSTESMPCQYFYQGSSVHQKSHDA